MAGCGCVWLGVAGCLACGWVRGWRLACHHAEFSLGLDEQHRCSGANFLAQDLAGLKSGGAPGPRRAAPCAAVRRSFLDAVLGEALGQDLAAGWL